MSTDTGTSLSANELADVLSAHHERIIASWQTLSPEQWEQPSRNATWSVHETARHVADCMDRVGAMVLGERVAAAEGDFDPRATPDSWLEASATDSPAATTERFATMAPRFRARVAERVAAGDVSTGATVYGPAHWSLNVVHLFWDSWLHERDMLVPLGLSAESTEGEQRLAAIYGLLMAMVPAKMMSLDFAASVTFDAAMKRTVEAAHGSGQVVSSETLGSATELEGDLCLLVDALSGRGTPLRDLLPSAPDMLCVFPDLMTS